MAISKNTKLVQVPCWYFIILCHYFPVFKTRILHHLYAVKQFGETCWQWFQVGFVCQTFRQLQLTKQQLREKDEFVCAMQKPDQSCQCEYEWCLLVSVIDLPCYIVCWLRWCLANFFHFAISELVFISWIIFFLTVLSFSSSVHHV